VANAQRTVRIRFDGSAAGFTKAAGLVAVQLRGVEKRTDEARARVGQIPAVAASAFGALVRLAGSVATVAGGVGGVIALVGVVAQLSGAAGLAVPAMFALAGVMAAVKLGADGIKRAFEPLGPTLDKLKAQVSGAFEKSLAPAVSNLKRLLPQLSPGLRGIATEVGGVATKFTAMLATTKTTGELNTILGGTSKIVQNIGNFLAPVGRAFITIGATAMPILERLTGGLGGVGERFDAFIQRVAADGSLTAWIENAIAKIGEIIEFFQQIGSIVGSIFQAANAAGLGFGGTLGTVVGVVDEFLSSVEGQTALTAFFTAINQVATVVGTVLAAALRAVAPIIPPLSSAFAAFATMVGAVLVPAIRLLAPVLQGLASFLAANMVWLGPLVLAIGGLVLVVQAVTMAINAWRTAVAIYTIAQWALNAAMTANPIGLVIAAVVALIAVIILIVTNLDFFRGIWDAVWKWCSDVITSVVNWIIHKWELFKFGFQVIIREVKQLWDTITGGIRSAAASVIDWIVGRWNWFGDTIKGVFRGIGSFIGGVWDGIKSGFRTAINGVISFANGAIRGINTVSGAVGIPAIPQIPMLARGGTARRNTTYLVGEEGPELFTPGRTGRVTNAGTTAEAMGAGSAPPIVHVYIGDRELTEIVDVRIEDSAREAARTIRAGTGGYR
jgi:phage-related protein